MHDTTKHKQSYWAVHELAVLSCFCCVVVRRLVSILHQHHAGRVIMFCWLGRSSVCGGHQLYNMFALCIPPPLQHILKGHCLWI